MATPAKACVCVSQVWSPERAEQPELSANSSAAAIMVTASRLALPPLRYPRAGTSGPLKATTIPAHTCLNRLPSAHL